MLFTNDAIARQYLDRGIAYFGQHQFQFALVCFDEALRYRPDDTYAKWNRATTLLSLGDYQRGFREHDVAWRLFNWRGFSTIGDSTRLDHLPLWRGQRGVKVLAYHELGHGDAIMAMRWLDELAVRADVTLVIDQSLARLARTFLVEVATQLPDDLSSFAYRLPFFGVMSALEQTAETIPAEPYIGTGWRSGAGGDGHTLACDPRSIGIAWSGRTQTMFTLERFLSLFAATGFELYSLQPGAVGHDVEPLPAGSDFFDLANRIEKMDHIVSVDTAAIHLAGAMGHPSAHLLLPSLTDWRWHRTELWYPQLKTYRQVRADDWSAPFAQLNEALHREQHHDHRSAQ